MALCAIQKLFLATKWEHPVASNYNSAELRFPSLATLVGSSSHANRIAHGYYILAMPLPWCSRYFLGPPISGLVAALPTRDVAATVLACLVIPLSATCPVL